MVRIECGGASGSLRVVNGGQAALYEHVVRRAAAAGLIRRAFYNEADAREWLSSTMGTLDDHRVRWARRG